MLEFGERSDLPLRIGAANTLSEATNVVAPLVGGLLASLYSFPAVFACAIGFKVLNALLVLFWLREPRTAAISR